MWVKILSFSHKTRPNSSKEWAKFGRIFCCATDLAQALLKGAAYLSEVIVSRITHRGTDPWRHCLAALSVGNSHNYYLGRAEANLSLWIKYFCQGMADSFVSVRVQAEKFKVQPDQTKLLRELDAKQKRILDFYRESRFLTTREIAEHLGVTPRTALNVCHTWLENGFILSHGEKKNRRYELTETWVELL